MMLLFWQNVIVMPNHRNLYISLAASMSKTGKFQLTPLVEEYQAIEKRKAYCKLEFLLTGFRNYILKFMDEFCIVINKCKNSITNME